MLRASYEDRQENIRRTEYGSRAEILTRHSAVVFGAIAVAAAFEQAIALVWAALHLTFQGLFAGLLTNRIRVPARERYRAALAMYALTGVNYAAYPLYLLATSQSLPLTVAAVCGVVSHALYLLQRRQTDPTIVIVDVTLSAATATLVILSLLQQADDARDMTVLIVVPLALLAYHLVVLFSGLSQQQRMRETQHRYANSQKARALNQFVGGVAHDFNNQLTAILGHLELFDLLDDDTERRNALEESRRAARRAALTVQQLLASSGRTRLSPRAVPMADFLAGLRGVLGDLLNPAMRITLVPPTEGETAWVDADMLETCMIQLCLNAQDATRGTGRIRIWVEKRQSLPGEDTQIETPPPYAVLFCEDDGPGVSTEALPLLAEPFYTTKRANEGAGLGLSAVAGFARQSGGALIITRAPLAGLRIALALPSNPPPPNGDRRTPGSPDTQARGNDTPAHSADQPMKKSSATALA